MSSDPVSDRHTTSAAPDARTMSSAPVSIAQPWTVLYDQDCGFCRWSLGVVLRADRRRQLRPVALQWPEAKALLADLTPEQRMASWHLISPAGDRSSAGAALPTLVALLPGGRLPAAGLARIPELDERGYRWVAGHRSWFGRVISARSKQRADEVIAHRQAGS
jgi:predicted DCC family thiol-disulfide oxidoreductase YuxK